MSPQILVMLSFMIIKTEPSDNKANWSYLEIVILCFMIPLLNFYFFPSKYVRNEGIFIIKPQYNKCQLENLIKTRLMVERPGGN